MNDEQSSNSPSAIDYIAREQVKGLRGDFHEFRDETRSGFSNLDRKMEVGLDKINQGMKDVAASQPHFGIDTMKTVVSVGAVGVGAFWLTVNLLVNPLAEKLKDHTAKADVAMDLVNKNQFEIQENRRDIVSAYERSDHDAVLRDKAQQAQIDDLVEHATVLSDRQLKILTDQAREEGRNEARGAN